MPNRQSSQLVASPAHVVAAMIKVMCVRNHRRSLTRLRNSARVFLAYVSGAKEDFGIPLF